MHKQTSATCVCIKPACAHVQVTEDQRIALVEYIAHLSVEDWEGVAHDLVKLGESGQGCTQWHFPTSLQGAYARSTFGHLADFMPGGLPLCRPAC